METKIVDVKEEAKAISGVKATEVFIDDVPSVEQKVVIVDGQECVEVPMTEEETEETNDKILSGGTVTSENLCEFCQKDFPSCGAEPDFNEDGEGVLSCDDFFEIGEEHPDTPVPLTDELAMTKPIETVLKIANNYVPSVLRLNLTNDNKKLSLECFVVNDEPNEDGKDVGEWHELEVIYTGDHVRANIVSFVRGAEMVGNYLRIMQDQQAAMEAQEMKGMKEDIPVVEAIVGEDITDGGIPYDENEPVAELPEAFTECPQKAVVPKSKQV